MAVMSIEAWQIIDGVYQQSNYFFTSHKAEYGRATGPIAFYHDGIALNNSSLLAEINGCLDAILNPDPNVPGDIETDELNTSLFDLLVSMGKNAPELFGLETFSESRVPSALGASVYMTLTTSTYFIFSLVVSKNGSVENPLGNPLVYKKMI